MKIIEPHTQSELDKYYDLRYQILRKPWNQPATSTQDDSEHISVHLLMMDDKDEAVATGRLQLNSNNEGQIRSMAVRTDKQGQGLGKEMMKKIEEVAALRKLKYIILDARQEAVGFYQKMGYEVIADSYFLFNTIRHYRMKKQLQEQ